MHASKRMTFGLTLLFGLWMTTAAHGQLVVNEIDYDQPGSDSGEFLEIKNVSAGTIDLSAYTVVLVNGSNGTIYQTVALPAVDLAAGAYYVLCENAADVANCNLDILTSIQNGGPDAVAITAGATIIDTVSYEGDTIAPYTETTGVGLIDIGSTGFEFSGISRFEDGVDTDNNAADFSPRCITPGATNTAANSACPPPPVSGIVVNEVDIDQPGVDTTEFIELLVIGNQNYDLQGHELRLADGTTGTVYQTIPLSGIVAAGTYLTFCADNVLTPNCDVVVPQMGGFIQDAGPAAIAIFDGASVVDTLSYGGSSVAPYTEGSGVGLVDDAANADAGLSRFPNGTDSDTNNTDFSARCITPGTDNTSVAPPCSGGNITEIFTIQGNGLASALEGSVVTTADNIVTALTADGFVMQTPSARSDGDADTSDGIFVFTGAAPTVAVGDQVDVIGTVDEFFDLTEITNSPLVSIDSSGNALPAPATLDATLPSPVAPQSPIELERYEGMLVQFSGVATGGTDRFGDTPVVASANRPFREPGILFPGLTGLPVWDGNPEIFEVDVDGATLPDQGLFGGQSITATGPLTYSFGDYQVLPTAISVGSTSGLPRAIRAALPGEVVIASQNLLRLFDTVDDPLTDDAVTSPEDFAARLAKFSFHARVTLGAPDIIALQEVENLTVVQALADTIAADDPSLSYSAYIMEGNDVGGIDVAYLTRDDTISVTSVMQHGANELLSFDGSLLNDRPPLVLEADYLTGGTPWPLTVINVHQRSLGGIEGNDEVRVRTKRHEQGQSLAQLIQDTQTNDPAVRLVVTGDFNAFQFTDGYVDVMGQVTGVPDPLGAELAVVNIVSPSLDNQILNLPAAERYSFIFGGSAQVLDHSLTSSALAGDVRGIEFARGNVDAPNDRLLALGPDIGLRIADHDAHAIYLMSDFDGDGVADDMDNCTAVVNVSQLDTNSDGFGNRCDPDLDNNGIVNVIDLGIFRAAFFGTPASANWNPDADFDGNQIVNVVDLGILRSLFFMPPGPSGITN